MSTSAPAKWGLRSLAFGYLGLLLLAPVGMIFYKTFEHGFGPPWEAMTSPEAIHAIQDLQDPAECSTSCSRQTRSKPCRR